MQPEHVSRSDVPEAQGTSTLGSSAPKIPPSPPVGFAGGLVLDLDDVRLAVEGVGRALFLIDSIAQRIHYVSPEFAAIWQRAPAELQANPELWYDTIHPEDLRTCRDAVEERLRAPERRWSQFEYRIYRPSGEIRWVRGNVFRWRNAATGEPLLCGVAEDITDVKHSEATRDQHRRELEDTVARRTADLRAANDRLQTEIEHRNAVETELRARKQRLQSLLLAQEAERKRISHEVHDGSMQRLIAAVMHLHAAADETDEADRRRQMDAAMGLVSQALDECGRIIRGMRPQPVEELGVAAAIEELVRENACHGLHVDFVNEAGGARWSAESEMAIYRIVQESLNNVHRHAGVEHARVELRVLGGRIEAIVSDLGCGFAVDPSQPGKSLQGIRDRAGTVGGTVRIDSAPGRGTRVQVLVPTLPPAEAAVAAELQSQLMLWRSRERLASILDQTPVIVFVKDHLGRYECVNRQFKELFNLGDADLTGMTDYDIAPTDVAEKLRENDRRALLDGKAITIEETVPGHDGVHEFIVLKFPIPSEHGGPPSLCGIATDVTERKRKLLRLRETQDRFQSFMDHLPVIAWIKRADGRYVFANRQLLALHELQFDDFHDRTDFDIFPPNVAECLQAHDRQVFESGGMEYFEETAAINGGPLRTWRSYKFLIGGMGDEPLIGGIAFDMPAK